MSTKVNFMYKGESKSYPDYQSFDAAGIDLFNNSNDSISIKPAESKILDTGFYVEVPKGYMGTVFARSSLGFKFNCTLTNSVGIIDSDYRGEVKVKITNLGNEVHTIGPFERVAQFILVPILRPEYILVDELSNTERGTGGFGSTGKS